MSARCHDPAGIADRLRKGQLGILTTDTLPGLHCRANDADAVARIRDLKGRDADKPLLVLCADRDAAFALIGLTTQRTRDYADSCWPGPFTLVFMAGPTAPPAAISADGTVAIRVPADGWLLDILKRTACPLVSTSVNRVGEPPALTLTEAETLFGSWVDFSATAAGSAAQCTGASSCLLDMRSEPPRVLRRGPLAPPVWPV